MRRLLGENLPVKLLGLAQPPRLVVLQCLIEGLLDRDLGHGRASYHKNFRHLRYFTGLPDSVS